MTSDRSKPIRDALPTLQQVTFSVGSVARRLGMSTSTLRSWDRRYGLGPQSRTEGMPRRYDVVDLQRAMVMQRLIGEGVAAEKAARLVLAATPSELYAHVYRDARARFTTSPTVTPPVTEDRSGNVGLKRSSNSLEQDLEQDHEQRRPPLLDRGVAPEVSALTIASLALDTRAMSHHVMRALQQTGPLAMWTHLVQPALEVLNASRDRDEHWVESERSLIEVVKSVLHRQRPAMELASIHRPVLLSCPEGRQRDIALHVLELMLLRRGVLSCQLDRGLPRSRLVAASLRVQPAVILLWAMAPIVGTPLPLEIVARPKPARIILAGPGWAGHARPAAVSYVEGLAQAFDEVVRSVGPATGAGGADRL